MPAASFKQGTEQHTHANATAACMNSCFPAGGRRQATEEGPDARLAAPKRRRHGAPCGVPAALAGKVWCEDYGGQSAAAQRLEIAGLVGESGRFCCMQS